MNKAAKPKKERDAIEELRALSSSKTAELSSKFQRLDGLIGEKHWPSVGSYKESILRNQLRESVPHRFTVGTGFAIAYYRDRDTGKPGDLRSRQTDIIVWDSAEYAPLFRDGEFAVVPADACQAAVEVTGNLTRNKLKTDLDKLHCLIGTVLLDPRATRHRRLYTAVFAYNFTRRGTFTFPDGLFDTLQEFYSEQKDLSSDWNSAWPDSCPPPWVSAVVVQGVGAVCLQLMEVNGILGPVYRALGSRDPRRLDDTYGLMERDILATLDTPQFSTGGRELRVNVPGELERLGFSRRRRGSVMVLGEAPSAITSLGGVKDAHKINRLLYRPPEPRKDTAKKGSRRRTGKL